MSLFNTPGSRFTPFTETPEGFAVPVERIPAGKGFDVLVGLDDVKKTLRRRFIDTLETTEGIVSATPEFFLLMYGPPGTGKTSISRAIASEIAALLNEKHKTSDKTVPFISFDPNSALGGLVGDSEKQVASIFKTAVDLTAENNDVVIIFMDEAESLMLSRTLTTSDTLSTIKTLTLMKMTELARMNDEREEATPRVPGRVLYIAATNYPDRLDDAFLRRFERRVFIDLPDEYARKMQIRLGLLKPPFNLNLSVIELECLTQLTEGFSPSDLKQCLKAAQGLVPDLSYHSSAYFRLNERGKFEIVPLVDPALPPCTSCSSEYDNTCVVCGCVFKMVKNIPVPHLETTCFISVTDVIDVFAKQRPSLNQEAYQNIKLWHSTRGSEI